MTASRYFAWVALVLASVAGSPARAAAAVTLPGAAVARPMADVWVNSSSGVYHCPGSRYYVATKHGRMMSERAARAAGNRPAYGAECSAETSLRLASRNPRRSSLGRADVRVWLNVASSVYHCAGTTYYGGTARGQYMAQSMAQATGGRPAYGRVCL